MNEELCSKKQKLEGILKAYGSVAVAFSSGVDSTFLLKAAHDALGDRAAAVTVRSCLCPKTEIKEAEEFCCREGIRHVIIDVDPFEIDGFAHNENAENSEDVKGLEAAEELGMEYLAEGSNTDDAGDYRPGMRAIAELSVQSPLRLAGLSKGNIRELSRQLGLPTWDKPSYACLATRFVYGETITKNREFCDGNRSR